MCTSSPITRVALVGLALAGGFAVAPRPARADGREDFARFCAPCHGVRGDGTGPAAALLDVPPRDLTAGFLKFRSTTSGDPPRSEDLQRVVDEGLPGTAMPGWRTVLPVERRRALVEMVKTFSPRFSETPPPQPVAPPPAPPADARTLERGRAAYQRMQCALCHGPEGRGDGPAVPTLRDDRGLPIPPSDLTRGDALRRGGERDMLQVLFTGLDGTPMPSYADAFANPGEAWDLVRYLESRVRFAPWWRRLLFDPPLAARQPPGGAR